MSAVSLKLPEDFAGRIARLAPSDGQKPYAFIGDALSGEAARSELRSSFAAGAAKSEREALDSRRAYLLDAAFNYIDARAVGEVVRHSRARAWRADATPGALRGLGRLLDVIAAADPERTRRSAPSNS